MIQPFAPRTKERVDQVVAYTIAGYSADLQAKLLGVSEHEVNLIKHKHVHGLGVVPPRRVPRRRAA